MARHGQKAWGIKKSSQFNGSLALVLATYFIRSSAHPDPGAGIEAFPRALSFSLQDLYPPHAQQQLDGAGHGIAVGGSDLDHPEPGTAPDQMEKVGVGCLEGQLDHLFVWAKL